MKGICNRTWTGDDDCMTPVKASELKLIAGGSLAGLFKQLGPQFENASGHTLSIHFDSTPNIISRINAGTPFDAVVVPADVFKDAAAKSHLAGPAVERRACRLWRHRPRRRAEAGPVDTGCLQEGAARGLFGRVRPGQRRRRLHCQGLSSAWELPRR